MLNEIISQNPFTIFMSYALAVRCTRVLIMCMEKYTTFICCHVVFPVHSDMHR